MFKKAISGFVGCGPVQTALVGFELVVLVVSSCGRGFFGLVGFELVSSGFAASSDCFGFVGLAELVRVRSVLLGLCVA